MRDKQEVERRKQTAIDLVLSGYGYRSIADKLGVTPRTVNDYIQDVKKEQREELIEEAQDQVAMMERASKKRLKQLWGIILDQKQKTSDKNHAIKLIQNEELLSIKRRQLIGALPQDSPDIAIQNNNVMEGTYTIADSFRKQFPGKIQQFKKLKGDNDDN